MGYGSAGLAWLEVRLSIAVAGEEAEGCNSQAVGADPLGAVVAVG